MLEFTRSLSHNLHFTPKPPIGNNIGAAERTIVKDGSLQFSQNANCISDTMTEPDFPALFHFFGCYLHQDWELEFSDWRDAAREFISEEPRSQVEGTRRELRQLIDCDYDPEMLGRVLLSLCCFFDPKGLGLSDLEWLNELQQQLAF